MKLRHILFVVVLSLISYGAAAEQISPGIWVQTSSDAGPCTDCELNITAPTPHIIQIMANNGWIGYAYYNQQDDKYRGAFEWKAGQGAPYTNLVFLLELTSDGKTISMNAKSSKLNIIATFKKK